MPSIKDMARRLLEGGTTNQMTNALMRRISPNVVGEKNYNKIHKQIKALLKSGDSSGAMGYAKEMLRRLQ